MVTLSFKRRAFLNALLRGACGKLPPGTGSFSYAWWMLSPRAALVLIPLLLVGCETPTAEPEEVGRGELAAKLERGPERSLPADFYDVALEEASAVLESYLRATDEITSGGGTQWQAIESLVSQEWLREEQSGFGYFDSEGLRSIGDTTVDSVIVQSAHITQDQQVEVGILACVDGTGLFVLPAEYADPPDVVWQWHPAYEDIEGDDQDWRSLEAYLAQPGLTWGEERAVQAWLVGEDVGSLVIDSWEQWWGVYEC
jgi:hypothetical protein